MFWVLYTEMNLSGYGYIQGLSVISFLNHPLNLPIFYHLITQLSNRLFTQLTNNPLIQSTKDSPAEVHKVRIASSGRSLLGIPTALGFELRSTIQEKVMRIKDRLANLSLAQRELVLEMLRKEPMSKFLKLVKRGAEIDVHTPNIKQLISFSVGVFGNNWVVPKTTRRRDLIRRFGEVVK